MAGQVPDKIKKRRRERAMAEQRKIAWQISESFVGREIKVLVEGHANEEQLRQASISSWEHGLLRDGESRHTSPACRAEAFERRRGTRHFFVARSEADAPDIDGRVYIRGKVPVGEFVRVKVIGHTDYDLIAEPVS